MTDKDPLTESQLESLFDEARAAPPALPPGLLAATLADAARLQPARALGWKGWIRLLGGAPGLGGLVAASAVGLWLGVMPPDGLTDRLDQMLYGESEGLSVWDTSPWDSEEI